MWNTRPETVQRAIELLAVANRFGIEAVAGRRSRERMAGRLEEVVLLPSLRDRLDALLDEAVDRRIRPEVLDFTDPHSALMSRHARQVMSADLADERVHLLRADSYSVMRTRAYEWVSSAAPQAVVQVVRLDPVQVVLGTPWTEPQLELLAGALGAPRPGVGLEWFDDLLETLEPPLAEAVVARAGRMAPPATTSAVLLPLRLETRFLAPAPGERDWSLRVRVFPDDVHVTAPVAPFTSDEVARVLAADVELGFTQEVSPSGTRVADRTRLATERPDAWRAAYGELFETLEPHRVSTLLAAEPDDVDPKAAAPLFSELAGLPPYLEIWLARGGRSAYRAALLQVDRDAIRTVVSEDLKSLVDPRSWLASFARAKDVGLAAEIPLGSDPRDIDTVYVVGLGPDEAAPLFTQHLGAGRLSLAGAGSATNTVAGASTAAAPGPRNYVDAWQEGCGSHTPAWSSTTSMALTGDGASLTLPIPVRGAVRVPPGLVAATWPALWGWAGRELWGLGEAVVHAGLWAGGGARTAAVREHIGSAKVPTNPGLTAGWLHPEGPFPTLLVGDQPYALVPCTHLASWRPDSRDPRPDAVESALAPRLVTLRRNWAATAESRGTVVGAGTDRITEILGRSPAPRRWTQQLTVPLSVGHAILAASGLGTTPGPATLRSTWREANRTVLTLGLEPVRGLVPVGGAQPMDLPLVLPFVSEGPDVPPRPARPEELPGLLTKAAALGDPAPREVGDNGEPVTESLLLRLARRSTTIALASVMRRYTGDDVSLLEPLTVEDGTSQWRLPSLISGEVPREMWRTLRDGSDPVEIGGKRLTDLQPEWSQARACVEGWRALVEWLQAHPLPSEALEGASLARAKCDALERAFAATLDTASARIDPFVMAPAHRRLLARYPLDDTLEPAGPVAGEPPTLGAFGWVDSPRPRPRVTDTPATAGGLLLTLSDQHAVTAAVLRDRAISEPEQWGLRLDSTGVRAADELRAAVRSGTTVQEYLGRRVEGLLNRGQVARAREVFKQRDSDGPGRVCDGLAFLSAASTAGRLPHTTARPLPGAPGTVTREQQTFVQVVLPKLPLPGSAARPRWSERSLRMGELLRAVDTYADLLLVQTIHLQTTGRSDAAGAATDAAVGLAQPPEIDAHRTPATGRSVTSTVLFGLPAVPEVSASDVDRHRMSSPATIAEPAVAAYLDRIWGPELRVFHVDGVTVHLDEIPLTTADAVGLGEEALKRLLRRRARFSDAAVSDASVVSGPGTEAHRSATRVVRCMAGRPPLAQNPEERALAQERGPIAAGQSTVRLLQERHTMLRASAQALLSQSVQPLQGLTPKQAEEADPRQLAEVLTSLARWRITPQGEPSVALVLDAAEVLRRRLADDAAAWPADPSVSDPATLIRLLVTFAAGEGNLPVLVPPPTSNVGRPEAPGTTLPAAEPLGDVDTTWLSPLAAVRPVLARLDAVQCESLINGLAGFQARVHHAGEDPWRRDPEDRHPFVVLYVPRGTPADAPLSVTVLDRWSEFVPEAQHRGAAAVGFDAPTSRAPQALLLAVTPRPEVPLDMKTVLHIVTEARELAHARIASLHDLIDYRPALSLVDIPTAVGPWPRERTGDSE